ncbi:hypothetical protein F5148DRAFT_822103 [Russula earlei]|uniref:Uncharacterized protein n=1 Tax=Russula earlei TaxID=71964 RepID=A0ACC0UB85_9AGAM|nr:hypothetical protein F5148DRAFT_822103 [Russula earlei]
MGTDESRPKPLRNTPDHERSQLGQSFTILVSQDEGRMLSVRRHRARNIEWQEFLLPDGTRYFSSPTLHIVADLRNTEKLDAITTFLFGRDTGILPPPEWELWIRDASESTREFIPLKAWIHHGERMLVFVRPASDLGDLVNENIDRMESEYQYWLFMMSHPVHSFLSPRSVSDAIDALTWIYTSRLVMSTYAFPPPFSQEECQELLTQLRSFSHMSGQAMSLVRVVSTVLVRVVAWKQGRHWSPVTCQDPKSINNDNVPLTGFSHLRIAGDHIYSFVCSAFPIISSDHCVIQVSARELAYVAVVLPILCLSLARWFA